MLNPNVEAMLTQLAPVFKGFLDRIEPLLSQPVVRVPYSFSLANSVVLPAGQINQVLATQNDFGNNLEWPMEVHEVKFSQDIQHTFRDWQVNIADQITNQQLQKNATTVADLVEDNTGFYRWKFPWTIRPKGGAMIVFANNLDAVNPISVDMAFNGYLLVPRSD